MQHVLAALTQSTAASPASNDDGLGWSEWLSIASFALALLGACVSIPIAILAQRRSGRAEAASGRAEQRDLERLERERRESAAQRQAELVLTQRPVENRADGVIVPVVLIHNVGPAKARQVSIWVVDEELDMKRSSVAGGEGVTLGAGDEKELRVTLEDQTHDDLPRLRWRVAWTDNEGQHERTFDVTPG